MAFKPGGPRYANIGVLICWDQWYPEAARLMALRGAEILFYPTAIGWHPAEKAQLGARQYGAWETIQRAHAVANGCYVATANRVGHEQLGSARRDRLLGAEFRRRPFGEILAQAGPRGEVLVVPWISPTWNTRTHWPFLRDRRIDAYGQLTQRLVD